MTKVAVLQGLLDWMFAPTRACIDASTRKPPTGGNPLKGGRTLNPTTLANAPPSSENGRLLEAFDSYLARQARSAGTRRKYGEALASYSRWLGERAPDSVD